MLNTSEFEKWYSCLNNKQKEAVDTIYGPVMVVAGPGTGKTQIISLRAANIILKAWVLPYNILITTFTDAGVIAIKKRLFDFVGTDSYKINVCTIHAFCNEVIATFPEKFLEYRATRPIDEIEQIEIFEEIIENSKFKYLSSDFDKFYYLQAIRDKISKLKQEWITPLEFNKIIENEKIRLDEELSSIDPKLKKFQVAKEGNEKTIWKLEELNIAYSAYLENCRKMWVYDFSDMIDFVMQKFELDESLRYYYSEKYQFIELDEYQDTNNAQNRIINLIASASDNPNIMVVWDDDQSIYRFQWANLENMLKFSTSYPETKFVVLEDNYRSTQEILDLASISIDFNKLRIVNYIPNLSKKLNSNLDKSWKISFEMTANELEEKTLIINKIKKYLKDWIKPSEIAIIVRTNKEVKEISELLKNNSFEANSRLSSNILANNFIILLLDFLKILENPYDNEVKLADLIRNNLFLLDKVAVLRILRKLSILNFKEKQKIKIIDFLSDEKNLSDLFPENKIEDVQLNIFDKDLESNRFLLPQEWQRRWEWQNNKNWIIPQFKDFLDIINDCLSFKEYSFYEFVKNVIDRINFLQYVEQNWNFDDILDLYYFLETAKKWNVSKKEMSLEIFLKKISYHDKYRLIISRSEINSSENGINVLTSHQSKWLEYEAVIIPNLVSDNWEGKKNRELIKLPFWVIGSNISESIMEEWEYEEERRLFFVSLTRAKRYLDLIFSQSIDNKVKIASTFLQELKKEITLWDISWIEDVVIKEISKVKIDKLSKKEEEYIKEFLSNYKLSPSDLNKFLDDPKMFLRDTIFKYPFEDTIYTIFGKVYHRALEFFYLEYKKTTKIQSLDWLISRFNWLLSQEILNQEDYNNLKEKWLKWLTGWYDINANDFKSPIELEYDFRPRWIVLDWVPLSWKIDKIEELFSNEVALIDYKTWRSRTTNEILGNTQWSDGKYFRQLLFYKIMFDLDKNLSSRFNASELRIEFVEWKDNKYPIINIPYSDEDLARVKNEIKDSWKKINDIEFWRGVL